MARWLRSRTSGVVGGVLILGAGAAAIAWRPGAVPSLPTAQITRGTYVDVVEVRGDVRPLKSIIVSAPMQAGELQILKLVANGASVKAGDVVVEFDGSTLTRTL